jgi:hypothetical protein
VASRDLVVSAIASSLAQLTVFYLSRSIVLMVRILLRVLSIGFSTLEKVTRPITGKSELFSDLGCQSEAEMTTLTLKEYCDVICPFFCA